jgi:hypothetical protein
LKAAFVHFVKNLFSVITANTYSSAGSMFHRNNTKSTHHHHHLKCFYLKSFYLKSFLFEEFNNVNGGMDVVGSWSVGSSSMRWRIGTSDTVVKALPSVRVRI